VEIFSSAGNVPAEHCRPALEKILPDLDNAEAASQQWEAALRRGFGRNALTAMF